MDAHSPIGSGNMSRIIGDSACPGCRKTGGDRTGNHLLHFEDGGKHCTRCKYTEKLEDMNMKVMPTTIDDAPPYTGELIRGIANTTRKKYGVKVWVDEATGEPSSIFYPKGEGYKQRKIPKTFYAVGSTKNPSLFGIGVTKAPTLIIVGGEEDAMAAYDMMLKAMPHNCPAVVSLPDGEQSFGAVSKDLHYVRGHSKVVLCLDMDEAGKAATQKLAALLEGDVLIAHMPHKDPNECLLLGATDEFVKSIVEARKWSPGGIVHVADVMEQAMEEVKYGVSFPWPSLTAVTYGMRPGDGYYIGAGVKCGKSEWLNELVTHLLKEGYNPTVIKGEELASLTATKLAGKSVKKIFHRPDIPVDNEEKQGALNTLDKQGLILYDKDNGLDWEELKAVIRHAVIVENSKFIFIDPVVCMTDGMEASEANTFLQKFSREIDQMAKDLGFTYFCFTHLNAPRQGKSHERGGRVESHQFTGSRSMMRATTYMIGIERNKDPELDEEERNTSYFVLLEDRNNGNTTRFPVLYDKTTGDYLEPVSHF